MQAFNITSFENCERFCFPCNLKEHIGFYFMLYVQRYTEYAVQSSIKFCSYIARAV